jgi:hypothetical protein
MEINETLKNKEEEAQGSFALVPSPAVASAALMAVVELAAEANEYARNSKAENTRRAYRSDWADFTGWYLHHGLSPLPATPETIALYLTDCAKGLKPSTVQHRMASISQAHAAAGYTESPIRHALVRSVWRGIRREKGVAQKGKSPALTADIRCVTINGTETGSPHLLVKGNASNRFASIRKYDSLQTCAPYQNNRSRFHFGNH